MKRSYDLKLLKAYTVPTTAKSITRNVNPNQSAHQAGWSQKKNH